MTRGKNVLSFFHPVIFTVFKSFWLAKRDRLVTLFLLLSVSEIADIKLPFCSFFSLPVKSISQ